MYEFSAEIYDLIYKDKDYSGESLHIHELIQVHKKSSGNTLLDVACGTGGHIAYLKEDYQVEGLDLDASLLHLAQRKHPEAAFHQGNMTDFDLGNSFDAVTCLFSAIGYVKTEDKLRDAIGCMVRHLNPGGVLIVEPWLTPEAFQPNFLHAINIDEPELKITRMNCSELRGNLSVLEFHYLVGTPMGVDHTVEVHEIGLFTHEQYVDAFRGIGVELFHDSEGLIGRGLFIATKPLF